MTATSKSAIDTLLYIWLCVPKVAVENTLNCMTSGIEMFPDCLIPAEYFFHLSILFLLFIVLSGTMTKITSFL